MKLCSFVEITEPATAFPSLTKRGVGGNQMSCAGCTRDRGSPR